MKDSSGSFRSPLVFVSLHQLASAQSYPSAIDRHRMNRHRPRKQHHQTCLRRPTTETLQHQRRVLERNPFHRRLSHLGVQHLQKLFRSSPHADRTRIDKTVPRNLRSAARQTYLFTLCHTSSSCSWTLLQQLFAPCALPTTFSFPATAPHVYG